jgi:hypothetical protein
VVNAELLEMGTTATPVGGDPYTNVTDSNSNHDVSVLDNYVAGSEAPSPPALGGDCAVWLAWTNGGLVAGNKFYGYACGAGYWGGNAATDGGSSGDNTRWAKNITFTGNEIKHANTSGGNGWLWGSMGDGIVMAGNVGDQCSDAGFDNEGSANVSVTGNTGNDCAAGVITSFSSTKGLIIADNTLKTDSGAPLLYTWNASQSSINANGTKLVGNHFINTGTGISSVVFQASYDTTVSANDFVNVCPGSGGAGNMHNFTFADNQIKLTNASAGSFTCVNLSGLTNNSNTVSMPSLTIHHNRLLSDIAQPAGTIAISVSHGDFNMAAALEITENEVAGLVGWPVSLALNEGSTNYQNLFTYLKDNQFAQPNVTATVSGAGANGGIVFRGQGNVTYAGYTPSGGVTGGYNGNQTQWWGVPITPIAISTSAWSLSGWGAGASIVSTESNGNYFWVTVGSGGSPSSNPTLTMTIPYTMAMAPACVGLMEGNSLPGTAVTILPTSCTSSTTTITLTLTGTPAGSTNYTFSGMIIANGGDTGVVAGPSSVPFSNIGTGSNTTGTMTVGTGASITTSGTGVNNANQVNGSAIPASASYLGSNGSRQLQSVSAPSVYVLDINGTGLTAGDTVNFNGSTPAAGSNYLNLTIQTSKASTTDSVSVEAPYATTSGYGVTELASTCSGGQFSKGLSNGSNNCGTPSGGASLTGVPFYLKGCTLDGTGLVTWGVTAMSSYNRGIYSWDLGSAAKKIDCYFVTPHVLPSTTPNVILIMDDNDNTANHTAAFQTCDGIISTTVNVSLTCASLQNFTTTTTAYAPVVLTFAIQSTIAIDSVVVVSIRFTASSGLANNVEMQPPYVEY